MNTCSHTSKAYLKHWPEKQFAENVTRAANDAAATASTHKYVRNVLVTSVANNVKMNAQPIIMLTKCIANVLNATKNVVDVMALEPKIAYNVEI